MVALLGFIEQVGGHHHGGPFVAPQPGQSLPERPPRNGIQARGRLIKEQQSGMVQQPTDEIYAPWSDVFYLQQNDPGFLYANQILLGSPRTYEIGVEFQF